MYHCIRLKGQRVFKAPVRFSGVRTGPMKGHGRVTAHRIYEKLDSVITYAKEHSVGRIMVLQGDAVDDDSVRRVNDRLMFLENRPRKWDMASRPSRYDEGSWTVVTSGGMDRFASHQTVRPARCRPVFYGDDHSIRTITSWEQFPTIQSAAEWIHWACFSSFYLLKLTPLDAGEYERLNNAYKKPEGTSPCAS